MLAIVSYIFIQYCINMIIKRSAIFISDITLVKCFYILQMHDGSAAHCPLALQVAVAPPVMVKPGLHM